MPLYDYLCLDCGKPSEILVAGSREKIACPQCGSSQVKKLISAHSPLSGTSRTKFPGPGDTACCGSTPSQAACAGPGSCCGKPH